MKVKHAYSRRARKRRAAIFQRLFPDAMDQSILDLGGGDGTHIASVVPGHTNVTIAEIDRKKLAYAELKFGHKGRVLSESPRLPFESPRLPFKDGEFDIVFCSSAIEHVTGRGMKSGTSARPPCSRHRPPSTSGDSLMICDASDAGISCRLPTSTFR